MLLPCLLKRVIKTDIKEIQLRGYIPLGAPLNWEPVTGEESSLRTVASFTTNWFTKRVGIDFSEPYHADPVNRFESLYKMKKYVQEIFPQAPYFKEHDNNGFEQECATISGVFGVCFIAMVYGLEVVYFKNGWPAIKPSSHLPIEQVKNLKPFDLSNNGVVEQLFNQMEFINKNWGKIDGYLNYQGILNNAFKIRGTDILIDMIDDPGLAHHLFSHIADTTEKLALMIQKRQRDSGFYINSLSNSNCVVNMISADSYAEFILQHDIRMSKSFERFGIHSCNWVIDPYIEKFNKIENIGYIDFGSASDLVKVKSAFPDARRHVFYNPAFLVERTREEIRKDIERIYEQLAPCDLCLPDIDDFVPDEKIIDFVEIAGEIAGG
jgi:hypothetical protein